MLTLGHKERIVVFLVGLVLGLVLISFIHKKRAEDGPRGTESMAKKVIRDVVSSTGIKPLPEGTPRILRQSRLYSFDVVKSISDGSETTVWMLEMLEGRWPWVRVSSKVMPGREDAPEVEYYAADRILVSLQEGITLEQLKDLLAKYDLEYLQTYRKTNQHVVRVDYHLPLTVPAEILRLEQNPEIIKSAQPHFIQHF